MNSVQLIFLAIFLITLFWYAPVMDEWLYRRRMAYFEKRGAKALKTVRPYSEEEHIALVQEDLHLARKYLEYLESKASFEGYLLMHAETEKDIAELEEELKELQEEKDDDEFEYPTSEGGMFEFEEY